MATAASPEEQALHVGRLIFAGDANAIHDALLPSWQVEDIARFFCDRYAYTRAWAHARALEQHGWQPAAALSCNARPRILQALSQATGRQLGTERRVVAAFKAFDACATSLLDLVEALAREAGAPAVAAALFAALPTAGVDAAELTLSELCLDWAALQERIAEGGAASFDAAVWPALEQAGWSRGDAAGAPTFTPPADVAAAAAATGTAPGPCTSPRTVLALLQASGQRVPHACVHALRAAELEGALAEALAAAADPGAPHRHAADPSGKRPGTPSSRRKCMCANCGRSDSTVWRIGSAGLTLCNACGMYAHKHGTHRPEHLIAQARAKAEAHAAAAAAFAGSGCPSPGSLVRGGTPDAGEGELSEHSTACADSGSEGEEAASRRPRARRRTQANRRLANDDFFVLDGPLSGQQHDGSPRSATASPRAWQHTSGRAGGAATRRGGSAAGSPARSPGAAPGQRQAPGAVHERWAGVEGAGDNSGGGREARGSGGGRDLEDLLASVLPRSGASDASDASAADALVFMSRSPLSGQAAKRLARTAKIDGGAMAAAAAARGSDEASAAMDEDEAGWPAAACQLLPLLLQQPAAAGACRELSPESAERYQLLALQLFPQLRGADAGDAPVCMDCSLDGGGGSAMDVSDEAEPGGGLMELDEAEHAPRDGAASGPTLTTAWAAIEAARPAGGRGGHGPARPLQPCHSAPGRLAGGGHESPGGASPVSAVNEQARQLLACFSDAPAPGGAFSDGGGSGDSRTSSPTLPPGQQTGGRSAGARQGRNGAGSRGRQQQDQLSGDEGEAQRGGGGKSRALSRFAAEHRQQMDRAYSPYARSPSGSPAARAHSPGGGGGGTPSKPLRLDSNGEPVCCANCDCIHTCLWRRDKTDPSRTLCNACGIYKTNNGIDRPTNGMFTSWKNGKERVVRRVPSSSSPRRPSRSQKQPAGAAHAPRGDPAQQQLPEWSDEEDEEEQQPCLGSSGPSLDAILEAAALIEASARGQPQHAAAGGPACASRQAEAEQDGADVMDAAAGLLAVRAHADERAAAPAANQRAAATGVARSLFAPAPAPAPAQLVSAAAAPAGGSGRSARLPPPQPELVPELSSQLSVGSMLSSRTSSQLSLTLNQAVGSARYSDAGPARGCYGSSLRLSDPAAGPPRRPDAGAASAAAVAAALAKGLCRPGPCSSSGTGGNRAPPAQPQQQQQPRIGPRPVTTLGPMAGLPAPAPVPAALAAAPAGSAVAASATAAAAAAAAAGSDGQDSELMRRLMCMWAHAAALKEPIVCTLTGFKVFPDGRYARLNLNNELGMPPGALAAAMAAGISQLQAPAIVSGSQAAPTAAAAAAASQAPVAARAAAAALQAEPPAV